MLRPIPQCLLKYMVVIKVCSGMDAWQNPTWDDYTVKNVHIQDTNEVKKTTNNTEVVLRSILFVDGRRSVPQLTYDSLMKSSLENGRTMRAVVYDSSGSKMGEYEVQTLDGVADVPSTRIHHWEMGLV